MCQVPSAELHKAPGTGRGTRLWTRR